MACGYTTTVTRLCGTNAVGHDLGLAREYGDGGEIGVQPVIGREDTLLGTQVVAGHFRQGTLYARDGIAFGLERRF